MLVDEAYLDVLDAVGDSQSLDRSGGDRTYLGQERVVGVDGMPGLLEIGGRTEGLAGDGNGGGHAAMGDALDGDLRAVEVLLDQDRRVLQALVGPGCSELEGIGEGFGPVDADHTDTSGEGGGLDDHGVPDGHRGEAGLDQGAGLHGSGRRDAVAGEQGAGCGLVPTRLHHLHRVRGEAESAREPGRGDEVPLRPGDDARDLVALGQGAAGGHQSSGVVEIGDDVVDDEGLLPRRLGACDQDDVVRGRDLLQAVAAVGAVTRGDDEHDGTSGQDDSRCATGTA